MVRKKHMPRSFNVNGYAVKTWYAGQPTECDNCREANIAKDFPLRGKCRRCLQEGHTARDCKNPLNVWGTTAANAACDASSYVSGLDAPAAEAAPAAEEVPASSSALISSWASQVDLHNSECVSGSECLRDSSIVSTRQLFSSSDDTSGSATIAPSGSDDVVDHEACVPARFKVNDFNDTGGRSKSKRATGVLDHGAGCDSINVNDTASSDVISVTGVEKDPADISNINKILIIVLMTAVIIM